MTTRAAHRFSIATILLSTSIALAGCHAAADDPAGQAEELADPVRRQNAVHNLTNLYSQALGDAEGDRTNPAVVALADTIVGPLTETYTTHTEDRTNGLAILDLLKEMQDPRAIPAFTAALDWRTGVTEDHALRAAQAILAMEIPESEKAGLVTALSAAFNKISGVRQEDNQMRVSFVRAMGSLHHESSVEPLVAIMEAESENQHFLINRLAARQLGELGSAEAVEPMIKALFRFSPHNPALRMADVASEALVRIGRPALQPLLQVLAGNHAAANAAAEALFNAYRQRNALRPGMEAAAEVRSQAINSLGMLGMPAAFDPFMAELRLPAAPRDDYQAQQAVMARKLEAAVGLIRLTLSDAQDAQVRQAIIALYGSIPERNIGERGALLATMQNMYDPAVMPLMLATARDTDLNTRLRETAMNAFAHLSNAEQSRQLQAIVAAQPAEDQTRINQFIGGYLELGVECDQGIPCYIAALAGDDAKKVEKAATMIGLLAPEGDETAINALVERLDHSDLAVRNAALISIDHLAVNGSQAAVDKIEQMALTGGGQAAWRRFRGVALPTQARIRARSEQ